MPPNPPYPHKADDRSYDPHAKLCSQHNARASETIEMFGEAGCSSETKGESREHLEPTDVGTIGASEGQSHNRQNRNPEPGLDDFPRAVPTAAACHELFAAGNRIHIREGALHIAAAEHVGIEVLEFANTVTLRQIEEEILKDPIGGRSSVLWLCA